MKGRWISYSTAEMEWLEANRLLQISEYAAAFNAEFRRDVSSKNLHALRKRKGWKTGRTGQFVKGAEAHNKGQRCPDGTGGRHPNARRTQFKKGNTPHNTNYLGHERIDATDGYVYISVGEQNPRTGFERRYVLKHKWLWEQVNGPVPDGYALKCLGDRLNTDPSNWEAVPRALLPRLAGGNRYHRVLAFDDAPDDLKPTVLAAAKLKHRAREARKERRT